MWLDFFMYNGENYFSGTIIKVNYFRGTRLTQGEVAFVCIDGNSGNYYVKHIHDGYRLQGMTFEAFRSSIIEVTDRKDPRVHCPVRKRRSEFDIPGMLGGWAWYVALMLLFSIFKDRWVLYFFTTLYFFAWRRKKINEEGYYIEW